MSTEAGGDLGDLLGTATSEAGNGTEVTTVEAKKSAEVARAASVVAKAARDKAKADATAIKDARVPSPTRVEALANAREELAVRAILPDADRIRIKRREPDGKIFPIQDYTAAEIALDGDIPAFINKRIRPNFGDFDYIVYVLRGGDEIAHSTIPRQKAREDGEGNMTIAVMKQMIEVLQQRNAAPVAQAPSMSDELTKLMALMQGQGGSGKLDPTMIMMMPMLKEAMKPSPSSDPALQMMTTLLERMERSERDRERAPAEFPTLQSPPPVDESKGMAELVTSLAAALKPAEQPRSESLSVKDIIELMKLNAPTPPKAGMTAGEILGLITTAMPLITQMTGGGAKEELRDLRAELREVRGEKRSVKAMLEEVKETQELARALVPVDPHEQQAASVGEWTGMVKHIYDGLPGVLAAAKDVFIEVRKAKQAGATQEDLGVEPSPPAAGKVRLELTEAAEQALVAMGNEETDEGVMQAGFNFLVAVSVLGGWKKYIANLIQASKVGNKVKVLAILKGILGAMVDAEKLDIEAAQRAYGVFEESVDDVMEALAKAAK